MIDINRENYASPRDESGLTPTENMRFYEMMLNPRRRFPITRENIEEAVNYAVKCLSSKDERTALRAAGLLVKAEQINQADEHKLLDKVVPNAGDGEVAKAMTEALAEARADEHYARLRRAAAIGHSSQSGANGNGSKSGPLDDGPAPRFG